MLLTVVFADRWTSWLRYILIFYKLIFGNDRIFYRLCCRKGLIGLGTVGGLHGSNGIDGNDNISGELGAECTNLIEG